MKIVDFFIWKKKNEETRKIYSESQFKELILKITNFNSVDLDDKNELNETHKDEVYLGFNDNDDNGINECEQSLIQQEETQPQSSIESDNEVDEQVTLDNEINIIKKEYKRKKKANPDMWVRNKRKFARNKGESYIASNGKVIEAKQIKPNCGTCRLLCTQRISEEVRLKNFHHFYELGDLEKQRKFIAEHVKIFDTRRKSTIKSKTIQRTFHLDDYGENDNELIQVCKTMFLNTLVISSQILDTVHNKIRREGRVDDLRGKYARTKKPIIIHEKSEEVEVNEEEVVTENVNEDIKPLFLISF